MDDMNTMLTALENTLGKISVSGSENLQRLLGCIITVRKVKEVLAQDDNGEA